MSTSHRAAGRRLPRRAPLRRRLARRNPRLLWTRAGPARAARRSPPWPRRGCSATWCEAVETGTTVGYVDKVIAGPGGLPGAADGADPLRPAGQPGARREGAGRAARGLRRQRARAAGRRRRVGRLRRPADPDQPRRRPARLVGALGAAGVDDRGGHRGRHVRGGDQRRLVGRCSPACSACRRWSSACGGTSPAPRTATCARARRTPQINATLTETVEGARTVEALGLGQRADRGHRRRRRGVVRTRSATRSTCAPCSSRAWSCPT